MLFQANNLTSSTNELNETEKIATINNIVYVLADITAPTQEPIKAGDIDMAVNIITTLNKYDHYD